MSTLAITSLYLTTLTLSVMQDASNEYVIKPSDDYVKVEVFNSNSVENKDLTDWINNVNQKHFYNVEQQQNPKKSKPSIHLKLRIFQDEN